MKFLQTNKTKNKMVVMSGGIDSTLILLETVNQYKDKEFDGDIFIVYLDNFAILESKRNKEKARVLAILEKIEKEYEVEIKTIICPCNTPLPMRTTEKCEDIQYPNKGERYTSLLLPQSIMWTGSLMQIMPQFRTSDIEILFGFNLNDNFHAYSAQTIKETLETNADILYMGESKLKVGFPLINYLKSYIYRRMIEKYPTYFNMVWSCENPDGTEEECGYCEPCRVKLNTIREYVYSRTEVDLKQQLVSYKETINSMINIEEERNEMRKKYKETLNGISDSVLKMEHSKIEQKPKEVHTIDM